MTEAIGAEKSERSATRLAYRSGYYGRFLIMRVGTLELRVPQDRRGRFSTELFERYQRSGKALVGSLAEMYLDSRYADDAALAGCEKIRMGSRFAGAGRRPALPGGRRPARRLALSSPRILP